jgi:hypothetical protein
MVHRNLEDGRKVKDLEKHLEIVSQNNLKMESLHTKIEELDKWRNMENFKECNLTLDVKKKHIFISHDQRILTQHETWSKYYHNKGG